MIRGDKKFTKWRGGDVSRLESLTDAVFAIAITLLIVSHDVPKDYDEFRSVMWGFVGFGITFFALICIWYNNYLFHRRYGLEDSYTIFLNSLLIFLVLFYIYPLKFLAQILINFGILHSGFGINMDVGFIGGFDYYNIFIIYGMGVFLIWLILGLMYRHAYNLRDELKLDESELEITTNTISADFITCIFCLLSIILAIFETGVWPGFIYWFIGPTIYLYIYIKSKMRS